MSSDSVQHGGGASGEPADRIVARIAQAEGSGGNPHLARLLRPGVALRDLGDLVHALCAVHGGRPDMIECARATATDAREREWLADAAAGFADERSYLGRLVAAAGPLPSTPRQADCEAAFAGLRNAFAMLARSTRIGCATGAVGALVTEWQVVRPLLDRAAARFDVAVAAATIPAALPALPTTPATARALAFGAQQLLVQHRGLWDLLESRAAARDAG